MPSLDAARDTVSLQIITNQPAQQSKKPPVKIPWKHLICSGFIIVAGTIIVIVGSLVINGDIDAKSMYDLAIMMIFISLVAVPCGVYYFRAAMFASRKVPGYSLENIPQCGCLAFTY